MESKIVTAAVFIKRQAVLLMRMASSENLAGKWEFSVGKLETGETPESCLQSELQEELDVEVGEHVCDTLYNYPFGSILLKAYFVEWRAGNILLRTHDALQWMDYKDLLSFELAPADVEIAQKVQEVISHV